MNVKFNSKPYGYVEKRIPKGKLKEIKSNTVPKLISVHTCTMYSTKLLACTTKYISRGRKSSFYDIHLKNLYVDLKNNTKQKYKINVELVK